MEKKIVTNHKNPLLENIQELKQDAPESYQGFIYLWRCIPEDMFYLGKHKGKSNDKYRGSGKRFSEALEYYGITQFERVVVEYIDDEKNLRDREQYWLDKFNAVNSKNFYNKNKSKKRFRFEPSITLITSVILCS